MKPVKALILGLLLLVPILIFIFISVFGTHHFTLKTYYPKLDDAGKVVYDVAGDTVFEQVPYFKLQSLKGDSLAQSDLDEHIYVAGFFGLPCGAACGKMFSQLVRVQEVFANNPELKLVSIGVGEGQDKAQTLQELAEEYGVEHRKWLLLTGDKATVQSLAEDFHEPFALKEDTVEPSQRLVLVDKEKKIRGVYEGTDPEDVDRLILEINVLLDEYSKRK
ncbi:SCO family protein [Pontibacter litorisediminis]|uniref:SCO family protein n=1 Tax=Pontibacter litorisediminis TaxID=1846260 RepID=UPI0023EDB322|nr:SCO family protein [Pontibacter litorisediminis]